MCGFSPPHIAGRIQLQRAVEITTFADVPDQTQKDCKNLYIFCMQSKGRHFTTIQTLFLGLEPCMQKYIRKLIISSNLVVVSCQNYTTACINVYL